ncbi:MAG TPA: hypothetical protein VMP01_25820 [Pirellulaceae bacterium]|nr:hypothetical protein [Pirellulaceae bacterium]
MEDQSQPAGREYAHLAGKSKKKPIVMVPPPRPAPAVPPPAKPLLPAVDRGVLPSRQQEAEEPGPLITFDDDPPPEPLIDGRPVRSRSKDDRHFCVREFMRFADLAFCRHRAGLLDFDAFKHLDTLALLVERLPPIVDQLRERLAEYDINDLGD